MFVQKLPNLITPEESESLCRVFDAVPDDLKEWNAPLKRQGLYNMLPTLRLLHDAQHAVRQLVGFPIKPMYAFMGKYLRGGSLPKHIDKGTSKFSVTLFLGSTGATSEWPLLLQIGPQVRSAVLQPGDGLFYLNSITPHWRDPMPAAMESYTILLLHYLDAL